MAVASGAFGAPAIAYDLAIEAEHRRVKRDDLSSWLLTRVNE
jgi:hypothetical protein